MCVCVCIDTSVWLTVLSMTLTSLACSLVDGVRVSQCELVQRNDSEDFRKVTEVVLWCIVLSCVLSILIAFH